jgi:hypothetical protein
MSKPDFADRPTPIFAGTERIDALARQRQARISVCAYFKAQRRGFAPGHALEDWLQAEREIDDADRPR